MAGLPVKDIPRILETYLFCCPALDGKFRCLPKAGGYYDQDYEDMLWFRVIEQRVNEIRRRKSKESEK